MDGTATAVRALSVEPVTPAQLQGLRREWCALLDADAAPFQSPQWLLPWLETFRPEAPRLLLVRAGPRPVAIAPFFLHRRPGDGRRQLTLAGNGLSDRLDLIAAPADAVAAAEAVFGWLAACDDWDECDFRDLPAGSPLMFTAMPGAAEDVREPEEPCPAVVLPAAPAAATSLLSRKARSDLARCRRRAEEAGPIRVRTADAASLDELMAQLARIHALRWAARGEAGMLADPRVWAFHAAAARELLSAGVLRLHVLELGGRAIAAQYALRRGDCGYSYLTGFDPAFARFAPGALLTAFTLEDALREGARRFDFLRGREAYKYAWGAEDQPQVRRRIRR
jgi:CelD/BcsL family acetyltransferase involved in cellulose biosynthesis